MLFPYLEKNSQKKVQSSVFLGLNRTASAGVGEFSDMVNITSDKYPDISQSANLDTVQINASIKNIQGGIRPPESGEELSGFTGVADGLFYFKDKHIPFAYPFMKIDKDCEVVLLNYCDMIVILPQMYCYQYKNTEKNEGVYPLLPGAYDDYITVKTTGASGETITLTKDEGTTSWEEMEFRVGDSLMVETDDEKYSSLNVYRAKDKYDREKGLNVAYNALVKSVSEYELRVQMLNYNGRALGITDTSYEAINHEFKRTLRVYKRAPLLDCACIYANRIWGTEKNGECIFTSAPGKPYEFSKFSGLSTDSWYTEVADEGRFYGIAPLYNGVVAFKERKIYHIFGDRATNFNIGKEFSNCGCIDKNSIAETDSSIFFAAYDGIYEYYGAKPENISRKLGILNYRSVSAFSDGKKLYVSINHEPKIYTYTCDMGLWHIEGAYEIKSGFRYGESLYFVTSDRLLKQGKNYSADWSVTLCDITEDDVLQKGISDIFIRVENFENSAMYIFVSTNDNEFRLCGMADSPGNYTFRIPVRFIKGDKYSIKISGKGLSYIKDIQRSFYMGGGAYSRKG